MKIEDKIQYNNYKPCDDPNCEARTMDKWSTAGRHLHFIGDVAKPKGVEFVSKSGKRERDTLIIADLVISEYFKERLERYRNGRRRISYYKFFRRR